MSTKINPIIKKGVQLVRQEGSKRAQKLNSQGAKARKELTHDVVEISVSRLHENLDEIEAMRNAGVTQEEIAERFGVGRGSIQKFLSKHLPDATSEGRKFASAIRRYFSAKTPKEQNDAFMLVDPFLQKIAKEKWKLSKAISYEDYLQDLRMQLVNTLRSNAENPNYRPARVAYDTKKGVNIKGIQKETPVFVPLSEIKSDKDITVDMDFTTKMFEDNNYFKKRLNNSGLKDREKRIVYDYFIEDKNYKEIGDQFWLTESSISLILKKSLERLMNFKDLPRKDLLRIQ